MQYVINVGYTSNSSTRTVNGRDDLSKDELIEMNFKLTSKRRDGKFFPLGYFDLSVP